MKKLILYLLVFLPVLNYAQSLGKLTFTTEKTKNGYQIFVKNDELMPMSASFIFTLVNMNSTLPNNQIIVIPAHSKKFLVTTLSANQENKTFRFSYKNSYNYGDATQTKYDENYIYDLPFDKGKTYLIYQGYNGNVTHQNQNALDFSFNIGDKIFAAREGKVVAIEEKNNTNCEKKECAKFNNQIIILQPDGTFAEYLHLKQNGVEVKIGDEIKKGQHIGFSGNTGWSTGPHLHFSVFLNKINGERNYLKTKFKTSNSPGEYLLEKKSYFKNY